MGAMLLLALTAAVWVTDGTDSLRAQLDRIELQGVALRPGFFELAPSLADRTVPPAAAVWRAVADAAGSTWLGTGNNGAVYRIGRAGAEKVFESEATQVMALAVASDGTVFFGLTPKGEVWRVRPGGQPELHFATGEGFVYDLVFGPDDALYAATGPAGRLYRIKGGQGKVVFAAPQMHLACVRAGEMGSGARGRGQVRNELLVGTAPDGIVYRLILRGEEPPGVEVAFDTPLAEARAVVEDGSGGLYVAANPAAEGSDSARVYAVDSARVERWTWACPDSIVYDIWWDQGPGTRGRGPGNGGEGRLLVATGSPPRLYELDRDGHATLLYRFDEGQVLCIEPAKDKWLVGLGNPGRLVELGDRFADSGYVTSPPLDCGAPARFGRLDRIAKVPAGTTLEFDLRTGYSQKPDSTWTDWEPWGEGRGAGFAGRYVQWRARLGTRFANLTPRVERVELFYSVPNRAPAVTKLDVAGASLAEARLGQAKPGRELTWEALDRDGDSLEFAVEFRARGEANWIAKGEPTAERRAELDTRALADGWYEIRVRASDRPTRGTGALECEMVSRPFMVDNTGPVVSVLGVTRTGTGRGQVRFRVTDASSPVVACRVAVNAGEWQPVDVGMADALDVTMVADVVLPDGAWTIAVWAVDAQGNTGAGRKTGR
ncbi:MAG: hypothetical protein R6X13_09490 [bacterium]